MLFILSAAKDLVFSAGPQRSFAALRMTQLGFFRHPLRGLLPGRRLPLALLHLNAQGVGLDSELFSQLLASDPDIVNRFGVKTAAAPIPRKIQRRLSNETSNLTVVCRDPMSGAWW